MIGRRLVFGVTDGGGTGNWCWSSEGPGGPWKVTPDGTPHNAFAELAPGRDLVAVYATLSESQLAVVVLGDSIERNVIRSGCDCGRVDWGGSGSRIGWPG
jgi:hypothetical protein